MPTKIYWIEKFANNARIGIMARPRGQEWLEDEISSLAKQGVSLLVSLLDSDEILELDLTKEGSVCANHGLDFINFPIRDRDVPATGNKTEAFILSMSQKLKAGHSIAIHCRMGIGRSS